MRIIFAGTPDFAVRALEAIAQSRHEVALVLTRPDRPAGRGMQLQSSPVKILADSRGLPVRQPPTLKDPAEWPALAAVSADVMVVAAYGLILPQAILDLLPRGAINIHASVLPRWRGAAPIQRALLAGDRQTGISIMQMDAGLDTGPVLLSETTPIEDNDTAQALHDRLAGIGARLILTALDRLAEGSLKAVPQRAEGSTYAAKIGKAETAIDWTTDAAAVDRQVRAFNPVPGAHTRLRGAGLKVWRAEPVGDVKGGDAKGEPGELIGLTREGPVVACGTGALRLVEVQRAGGRRVRAAEFLHGQELRLGERLGE